MTKTDKQKKEAKELIKMFGRKEDFYLDPFEFINKPRRVFTGLEIRLSRQFLEDIEMMENDKDKLFDEKDIEELVTNFVLIKKLIKTMNEDFYNNEEYCKHL